MTSVRRLAWAYAIAMACAVAAACGGSTSTPTFIVGGQKVEGARSFAEFDAILASLVM